MATKFLAAVGVLSLLAIGGAAIAALVVVKDRVRVTIASEEEAARRGPDPLELLRADVGVLSTDLAEAKTALPERLREVYDALESSAAEREQRLDPKLAALDGRIAALERKLAAAQEEELAREARWLATLRAERETWAAQFAGARVETATREPLPGDPTAVPAAEAPAAVPAAETPAVAETTPPPVPAESAPPKKKGFLAFDRPTATFDFSARQRFQIVPSLSRVGFDAKSTLHDFSGVTSKVEGELTVNLSAAADRPKAKITADAASLDTGLAGRDEDMRKTLAVETHKSIEFEWTSFEVTELDAAAMKLAGKAKGKLTIRGKTREIEMPVQVSVDAARRVAIEGECTIQMKDFEVEPPSQLGMIKVDDELKLWISLRARFVGLPKERE